MQHFEFLIGAAFGGRGWGATSAKRSIRRSLGDATGDALNDIESLDHTSPLGSRKKSIKLLVAPCLLSKGNLHEKNPTIN
jgi:hypothetical protein